MYDLSHIGHARAYVTFDIVRRILEDYFRYSVHYVMNVTDIDDKIILRARREWLVAQYREAHGSNRAAVEKDVREKGVPAIEAKRNKLGPEDPKREMHGRTLEAVAQALADPTSDLVQVASEALAEWLDLERGASVTETAIFGALPRRFEDEFFADMKALGMRLPSVVTRVSEYVPEIVSFTERVVANGYAYESNGSVYFDTKSYMAKHQYAKLCPEHINNDELLAEGEGALSGAAEASEKRSPRDFALWKRSKPGEPWWDSPWGKGRPGWHIECSAMAADVLPDAPFDIHGGGVDLKFPHHDNELAQSEAFYEKQQWVNYFMHAGHVHIQGLKMSKSLKNFVTIRDARSHYTPRQIRFFFLGYGWDAAMDYGPAAMQVAIEREAKFKDFFHAVRESIASAPESQHWGPREVALNAALVAAKEASHQAICDNLDYPKVLGLLLGLVADGNKYLAEGKAAKVAPRGFVLRNIASFITGMFKVFGVVSDGAETDSDFGFGLGSADGAAGGQGLHATLEPYLRALATFREDVRRMVREGADKGALLALTDRLRDEVLPELGVRLEDRPEGAAIKLEDPAELKKELARARAEKEELALRKQQAKEEQAREAERRAKLKERAQVEPADLFRAPNDTRGFTQWDQAGLPTHSAGGKEITPEEKKALEQELKEHIALRKKLLKK